MKVLWFSLSPCGSLRRNASQRVIQGWMISLEDTLKENDDIELHVAYFSDKKEDSFYFDKVRYYPMYRNIYDSGYSINRIRERFIPDAERDSKAVPVMLDVIRQAKPDIIHIHGTEESFGLIVNYIKDIPIVFSIQGMIAPYKEKFFSGMPEDSAYKFDPLYDRLKGVGIRNQYKSFCYRAERERSYLSQAKYIFGRTFWDRDCTLALNPKRKYFVVNEILRPEFYEHQWKGTFSSGRLKLVSTISGGIYKGMEMVLKAAELLKKYGGLDFEWHIAGYDESSKWVRISEKVTGLNVNDFNIIFHGRIGAEPLAELLCASDIYVHLSHIENSPNSVCEAMIVGMPVIASYAGGTASLLKHEKEGVLYQDGDPYVLSGAIIEIFQHPETAMEYAAAARVCAMKRHSRSGIVNELISAYRTIMCSRESEVA